MLDLPGIVSGDKVGFLDPHKECFGNGHPGKQYVIKPSLLDGEIRDQFKPFQGVFDFDFHKNYESTLFRFPLRTCPSKLSQTEYTKEKVDKLFKSLHEEASIILLFMKNIHHISVHECIDGDKVKCVFKVEIAPEMCEFVKQERQMMLKNAVEKDLTELSYIVDVFLSSESGKKCFKWFVLNQIGLAGNESMTELSEKLSLLPWVGCAVALNENAQKEDSGRIFCFLPLPRDVDCQTGLPVLVHGAFGVTDNRRGLLWPGSECQNNETAEWNLLLVEKILSSVIYNALKSIITDCPITGLNEIQRRELVYSIVPKLNGVIGHWNSLLDPLFQKLTQLNLFHAQSSRGTSWITLEEGLLDQMKKADVLEKNRNAVLEILLRNSKVIITDLPDHVSETFEKYFGKRQDITSEFFRNFLRSNSIQTASHDDKLLLLDYVLHDDPQPEELTGIPLLPLASGKFVTFTKHRHDSDPSSSIFVSDGSCTEDLLPNMEDRFLDKKIPAETYERLVTMATGLLDEIKPTQMITLTPEIVIACLRSSLPDEWFNASNQKDIISWNPDSPSHPPEKWINDIWHWINDNFESLEQFEGIPLIPLQSGLEKALGVLSKNSRFIFNSDSSQNMQLPSQVVGLLKAAGCIVLPCTSALLYVRHPDISSYVASPVPAEVTLMLGKCSMESADNYIRSCSKDARKFLQSFFSTSQALSEEEKNVLRSLPLLDTLDGSYTAALVSEQFLSVASSKFKLPEGFNFRKANQIISSAELESLVRLLGLEPIEPSDIFCRFLFPDIQTQSVYSLEETTSIMLWILERKCEIQNEQFLKEIKDLSFLSTRNGELKKPCELYDPSDPVLIRLFLGEDSKFPSEEFSILNSIIKELGLRAQDMITESDLLGVAERIALSDYHSALEKVQALVTIFHQRPEFLQLHTGGNSLISKLAELKWLPRAKEYPRETGYPNFMCNKWYSSEAIFYKPDELFRESHTLLVGTSAPILGIKMNDDIQNSLGIQKQVNVNKVIEHLKTAISIWQEEKRPNSQYNEMLQTIYLYLSKVPSQDIVSEAIQQHDLVNWIWHGSGFCSPKQMALEKDLPFEFRPPLFLLPDTLNDGGTLTRFFETHGVREQFSKEDIILVLAAIKEAHEDSTSQVSSKCLEKDLKFCRSILEWLVNDGQRLSEDLRAKVFVPVQSDESKLVLKECEKCTYCDQDWLKHGKTELDIPDDFHPIHEDIPPKLAILLGVPSLSSCLLSSESIEFEQTGPYEPITTRIKNILKEYKEGVGIFKELIQNADDAGATTVKFLVDWRQGKTDSLFSPDMVDSQGPALWAYNNAVFTDKDFENINKLAGGTKVEDLSKIGRFGLGFNAVYHLTDVPSFISRNYLCIFDPNVNHISNHIRDKSRPGIRIDLAKNSRPLTAFADQFSLYNEVFGCKTALNNGEKFHYQGTLFRFSFRTECEAKKSEICETVYDPSKVREIVRTLQRSASLLLLFTQNVNHVELHELGSAGNPQDTTLVLSINKEIQNTNTVSDPSYIKQCSEWWQKKLKKLPLDETPSSLEQVKIVKRENPSTITDTETSLAISSMWLVSYCVGKDSSIKFAAEEGQKDGLLPLAGAAALLQSNSTNNMVDTKIFAAEQIEGEAFCFLPLSISTGLPIHVNSSFAVRSNRDGIWEKTTAEENPESRWNDCLLQDAIPEAYFMLLSRLVDLSKTGFLPQFGQRFHDFWPRLVNCRTSWSTLVSSFYTKMVQRDLKLFCSNGEWMSITDGYILDDELRKYQDDRVIKTLQSLGKYVFDLPFDVINAMKNSVDSSVSTVLKDRTLSLLSFFKHFLFPNLPSISADLRNPIVHHGLHYIFQESREDWRQLESLYKKSECIPCSPDGQKLARPCRLINPNVEIIAVLYSPEENRFHFGELNNSQLNALEKLGMVKDLLSWNEICGRAKSIEELAMKDKEAALQRSRFLIKYLRYNIGYLEEKQGRLSSHLLQNIKFLPVCLTPPATYTLPWKGAEFHTVEFRNPSDLFLPKNVNLIGSSCLIVDDTDQSGCGSLQGLENVLSFSERPSCQQVLQQLEITRESNADENVKITVCKLVYRHLNDELTNNPDAEVIEKLQSMAWLFLDGKFVENKMIALDWKGYAVPFLYSVTDEYKREFAELLKIIGIKKVFTPRDFLQALDSLRESKKDSCMKRNDIDLVITLINELKKRYDASVEQRVGTIPLPDTRGVLFNSEDLTIPESFRVKYGRNERYIHSDINQNIALKLGAKSLRTRRREKYGNTMSISSFGQIEKLTDRIKNILKSYPCDVGILKELVQNADDAKATEVQFIYDKRTLPHERVLQDNAKKIQGPALCVYNNKYFSEDDFDGICKLGIGSKGDDPAKTGQYGIGFNAVYHLTDCPSFLSDDNNDITLCILDPHCEYSPEATQEAPGGRYDNIDDDFKDIFSDTVSGYLGDFGDHFPLQGSTMFRLPLRTDEQSRTSKISNRPVADKDMIGLFSKFQNEAKKLLLFLNHVKKICLWKIDENCELKQLYAVGSLLEQKNDKKLPELHSHLQFYKKVATSAVPIKDTTYAISIQDTGKLEENWLIHQRFGIKTETRTEEQTPNVCDLGLFPRGAVAALLSSNRVPSRSEEYVAYCFLPLPVKTMLPVHVNGHFALDGSRRDLWFDPSRTCRKTIWNAFMKKQVLGPAYASLITKAREYIPCEKYLDKIYFSSEENATKALDWYHNLFPNPVADPKWSILAVAVYQCLKETPILPVVSHARGTVVTEEDNKQGECGPSKSPDARFPRKCEETACSSGSFRNVFGKYSHYQPKYQESARESNSEHMKTVRYATFAERRADAPTKCYIEWLPPNIVYFTEEKEREIRQLLLATLLQIHMPVLLYTPLKIHEALLKSEVESHVLTPENVIKFLLTSQDENSRCNIGKLPVQLNSSNIQSKSNLRSILEYCEEALMKSPKYIHGLPLLLTDDNLLRAFSSETPVYCSLFSKLFPDKAFKFVQCDFVLLLSTFCVLQPVIIRNLTIQSLATEFMPDVFNGKLELGEKKHVPWHYPEEGVLSKEWFRRLWKFLQNAANAEKKLVDGEYFIATCVQDNITNQSSNLVKFLGKYPIIPTTDGKLATVDNAKTVLAVTDDKKGNNLEQKVSQILKSLACPFLDTLITKDALSVILRLVADPHRISDVLHVLHYMNSTGILDMSKFDDEKINTLLRYFQVDWQNNESMNIAKSLPFYKGVDGDYHSLSSYWSYIQVPSGLPDDGIKELQSMDGERKLFLPSSLTSELDRLFNALGIMMDCDISKFYITYVLPNFSSFSRKCQIEFLTNIKSTPHYMSKELKQKLQSTSCIPDQTGKLRVASSYFNPHDELFKVMFRPGDNDFPTAPFNKRNWLDFLVKIGMKEDCDEQQFIKFASDVAESARGMSKYDMNIISQSKALVKYLLESGGKNWFKDTISQIEFVVPEEVENELSSLHPQYCVNGKLEFVSFRESVPWKDRHLVWTCAKLLPDWAYPDNIHLVSSSLGIPSKPPLESVVEHVKKISKCATDTITSDSIMPEKLIEVFKDVYEFLKRMMQNCAKNPPSPNCSEECRNIGKCLTNVACILLSKERCLVKGEELSFEDTGEKLKPYFHVVPRDYVQYEHLLKRLGVTEKMTPSQMANVLKSIKDSCAEITMNSEEEQKACFATSVLLESLRSTATEVESRLSNCEELNLPSMKKRLVKSNKLVCKMQPRLRESVENQGYEILYPLEKCGLKRELEDAYLNALPKRLRPTPLSSLVREELDPLCKRNMTCIYCTKMDCPFIQKFILVLRSSQFEHGILRLLKHQKEVSTLDDEDRARAARFTSTNVSYILWYKISILFGLICHSWLALSVF
jgi:sacsin